MLRSPQGPLMRRFRLSDARLKCHIIFRRHRDSGSLLGRISGDIPEFGRGSTGQHGLNSDPVVGEVALKRMADAADI